jgi:hypothetical protein
MTTEHCGHGQFDHFLTWKGTGNVADNGEHTSHTCIQSLDDFVCFWKYRDDMDGRLLFRGCNVTVLGWQCQVGLRITRGPAAPA